MRGLLWEPVLLEPDPDHILIRSDGTVAEHFNQIMSEDMAGQIRDGYRCINCLEPFLDGAWPEECPVCEYRVKARQAERFGLEFQGSVRVGPSTSIDDELAIAEEMVQRQELAQLGMRKSGSIVVPASVRDA